MAYHEINRMDLLEATRPWRDLQTMSHVDSCFVGTRSTRTVERPRVRTDKLDLGSEALDSSSSLQKKERLRLNKESA